MSLRTSIGDAFLSSLIDAAATPSTAKNIDADVPEEKCRHSKPQPHATASVDSVKVALEAMMPVYDALAAEQAVS
jgi:hypothetical protein